MRKQVQIQDLYRKTATTIEILMILERDKSKNGFLKIQCVVNRYMKQNIPCRGTATIEKIVQLRIETARHFIPSTSTDSFQRVYRNAEIRIDHRLKRCLEKLKKT